MLNGEGYADRTEERQAREQDYKNLVREHQRETCIKFGLALHFPVDLLNSVKAN